MSKHKTINGWTKARMIEQIYKRNNGKSANVGASCLYRTPDGNACAVGCFIPDEVYTPRFEGLALENLFKEISEHMPLDGAGMRRLQLRHDRFDNDLSDVREHLAVWIEENVEDAT